MTLDNILLIDVPSKVQCRTILLTFVMASSIGMQLIYRLHEVCIMRGRVRCAGWSGRCT